MKKKVTEFAKMKKAGEKIAMVTAYDYTFARIAEAAEVDMILVGDSAGMVMLGYDNTLPVTIEHMITFGAAVRRGAPNTFIVIDMPFGSYQTGEDSAVSNAVEIMKRTGADALKLEGGKEVISLIERLVTAGIPVMGHVGMTPQKALRFGGFIVQGRNEAAADAVIADSIALGQAGAFIVVVEAVPAPVAGIITSLLDVPTIGIGAGLLCSGQVLVMHDLLGFTPEASTARFVNRYASLSNTALEAFKQYRQEVKQAVFPGTQHQYRMSEEECARLVAKYSPDCNV
jgi:3-methyl-2-oxobutanoate hydroxymethyltransferase